MIVAADVVVFVVSPDSAGSPVCDEEIACARALGKRIIPILRRRIDFDKGPPRLAALNMKISFVENATDFDGSLAELGAALAIDVKWIRESTRFTQAAAEWDDAGQEKDRLLQGEELREAQQWAARRPESSPPISNLVFEFMEASEVAEDDRRAIAVVERARFQELDRVTRPLLEEELRVRESIPKSDHAGVADEMDNHEQLIRSLLGRQTRWHPQPAQHAQSTGAIQGYAEIFEYLCCNTTVEDFLATGTTDPPSQFRADGCEQIPESIQYESLKPMNRFISHLVKEYRALKSGSNTAHHQ